MRKRKNERLKRERTSKGVNNKWVPQGLGFSARGVWEDANPSGGGFGVKVTGGHPRVTDIHSMVPRVIAKTYGKPYTQKHYK
jgi:hypothetical protein